ncbi:MAG: sulfite exporter TauE/SafE family protein [Proteobacteria bacterium]|nr:sulfite exporter TauE/SafE family protein [Pseudomonadota bacterium]
MTELMVWLPLVAVLLATGFAAGTLAGLLGVGGGIVIVPVLYLLFGAIDIDPAVRMHVAIGTSLTSIVATSAVSARAHRRRGSLDPDLLRRWAPWLFLGALGGTFLAGSVGGPVLGAVFGVVALAVSLHMAFAPANLRLGNAPPDGVGRIGAGVVIGGFSAMMGIGGGTLSVPFLSAFGVTVHRAIGTAAAFGFVIALPASIGFVIAGWNEPALPRARVGFVNLLGLAFIAPLSVLAAPLGASLAHRLEPRVLKRVFAVFLALTSIKMLHGALVGG